VLKIAELIASVPIGEVSNPNPKRLKSVYVPPPEAELKPNVAAVPSIATAVEAALF